MLLGYDNSVGFFNMNSSQPGIVFFNGNMTIGNTMRLGNDGSSGQANQNDGTVTINQLPRVGDTHHIIKEIPGTGVYNLSGVGVVNAARLEVGYGGDSSQFGCEGTFNLSGNSTLNISLGAQIPDPKIGGNGGVGSLNQSGGTLNSPFRIVNIGQGTAGSGVYNFSGGSAAAAGFSLAPNGVINYTGGSNLNLGQLSTTAGRVNVSAGANKVLRASLLWTSPSTWKVDLTDNASIISSLFGDGTMRQLIQRGYNGGAWTGNGITSASAAAQAGSAHKTALGYGTAADLFGPGGGTCMGFAVSGSTNLIRYTYAGDANLDHAVDSIDFNSLAASFGSSGKIWDQGDFNYDGNVDTTDFNLLASNFGLTLPASDLGTTVPEPASILTCLLASATLLAQRRNCGNTCKRPSHPRPSATWRRGRDA
jgi:hypothetical protein